MFCYVKCCKFVLVLQNKLPCPLLRYAAGIDRDQLHIFSSSALFLLSRRSILWNINGMVSSIFLTQPFLVRRL